MFKDGDLFRWIHHGPGEGKICKIKSVIGDKFTVVNDPYKDWQYDISMIRRATYEEIHQCVPQIQFFNEVDNPQFNVLNRFLEKVLKIKC